MSNAPVTPEQPPVREHPSGNAAGNAGDAPSTAELDRLYKMSKTAGLGSSEYVAINGTAIFALVMGVASILAVFEEILLVFPLIGTIASLLAFRQITRSAGTQGGTLLAALGLFLSLSLGSYVITRWATEARRTAADRAAIGVLVEELDQHIRAGDFDSAYAMFDPRFQDRIPLDEFIERFRMIRQTPRYGRLQRITTNNRFVFESDPVTGRRQGLTMLQFEVERGEMQPVQGQFIKTGSSWAWSDIPMLFQPTEPPPLPNVGGMGGGMPGGGMPGGGMGGAGMPGM